MLGIRREETEEFISKTDTADVKTIFVLRQLTTREKMASLENLSDTSKPAEKIIDGVFQLLTKAIVEIKNLHVEGDSTTEITLDLLDKVLSVPLVYELNSKISEMARVSEEEEKKS